MSINTLLGVRTDFSLGESGIASEDVATIAKRIGQKHVAVADTMCISGLIDIAKKAEKEDVELHMGVRLRIVDNADQRNKDDNKHAWYPKVFARNADGMRAIFRLLSRASESDRRYYVDRLSLEDLLTLNPDDVVITTGDVDGAFSRQDFNTICDALLARFGASLACEFIVVPTPYFERCNINLHDWVEGKGGFNVIATTPTLFDEGKYDAFFLNMAIQGRSDFRKSFTVSDPWFKDFGPINETNFAKRVVETIKGMRFTRPATSPALMRKAMTEGNQAFLDATPYRWKKEPLALPKLAADPVAAVMQACRDGVKSKLMKEVFGYKPSVEQIKDVYFPRLKYELSVLASKDFCDYFLVVADLVNWAKRSDIMVGPGRGSVGGSLIAYLMGITDIDPIRFDLLFERFINPSRNDLPDADLDFMSTRREEVIRYLEDKYGTDRVAGITNYGVLGSASALKDIARVYGVDMSQFPASKFIPSIHGQPVDLETARSTVAEMDRFADEQPKVWKGALATQGLMRSFGRHAAGTIVSGVPIHERGVVTVDGDGRKVNWDMRVCEDMGLVKLDVLGLSTLDTLSRCARFIKERHGRSVDLMTIPLDDPDTLKAFSEGRTVGVFQFEGGAARRILKDMAQTSDLSFNDLVAANALNRPGPIDAGLVQDYIDGRNGSKTIGVPHPNMRDALSETYNVIVYQEQVMKVAVDLCGFTLAEADKLRKAMGKKDPVMMAAMRKQFVDGAVSKSGMDEKAAGVVFDQIEVFAGYAFNKSHAAEYSLISYQCMWLKTHFPVEFYAACMSTVKEDKLQVVVNDAGKAGIKIMPPDINISTDEFVIGNDTTLYIPFNRIKGVSDKGALAIMAARQKDHYEVVETSGRGKLKIVTNRKVMTTVGRFDSMDDFLARVEKRLVNSRVVSSLDTVGAFARIVPGQVPSTDMSRLKDHMILMPGLMTSIVSIDRGIPTDKFTLSYLKGIFEDYEAITAKVKGEDEEAKIFHARSSFSARSKFMAVVDSPGRSEEANRKFAMGEDFQYLSMALLEAGLERADGYWTGLVKKRRAGKTLTPTEIKTYSPFLLREIELLKPPLIVTLGTNSSRFFVPELKGDMMDHLGRIFYNEKMDAMILIGFNPMMIHFAPEKQELLTGIFETVRTIIHPA